MPIAVSCSFQDIYTLEVFVTCETVVRHVTNTRFTRDEHPTISIGPNARQWFGASPNYMSCG